MPITKNKYFKTTQDIISSVLPDDFKIVKDKNSNGYKFINALYGGEFDNCHDSLTKVYDNSFLSTFDLTTPYEIFEVEYSGLYKNELIKGDGFIIRNVDDYEFLNARPTRIQYIDYISVSGVNRPIGVEYFKIENSGIYNITTDINHDVAEASGLFSNFNVSVNPTGLIVSISGYNGGVETQSFADKEIDEIVTPQLANSIREQYPDKRKVEWTDSKGIQRVSEIDHYEPYQGYEVIGDSIRAIASYTSDYYFDEDGKKIFFKTCLNNPYGSGVYNISRVPLQNIPISGTLKVFDIDNLDSSGNAIEIPRNGKTIYRFNNPDVDPVVYEGYDSVVPFNRGFISQGLEATPVSIVSWNYVYDGTKTLPIIQFTNPTSRYLVEYNYSSYKKNLFISSTDTERNISLNTPNKLYTLDQLDDVRQSVDFQFSRGPIDSNHYITFDPIKYRPNSFITSIKVTAPTILNNISELKDNTTIDIDRSTIGYTKEIIPPVVNPKELLLYAEFNSTSGLSDQGELDISNNNDIRLYSSGLSSVSRSVLFKMPAKKINYKDSDIFYYQTNTSYATNVEFHIKFKPLSENINLIETSDESNFLHVYVENSKLILKTIDREYISRDVVFVGSKEYILYISVKDDRLNSESKVVNVGYSDNNSLKKIHFLVREIENNQNQLSKNTILFYNSNIIVGSVKIFKDDSL